MPALNVAEPAHVTLRRHVLGRLVCPQTRPVKLLRWALAGLAIVLGLAHLKTASTSLLPQYVYGKDLLQGYTLARAIVDRVDPYLPTDMLAERYVGSLPVPTFPHPTPHPPTLGLLLLPLALLDYRTAATVWFGLELGCLVAAVYLLGRALDVRLSIWATVGTATALLIWYPFPVELIVGQLHLPMLVLLAGGWVALRSGRSALGGALLGLAIVIKPVPLPLLLLLLLRHEWRALTGAVSVVLGAYCAAACVAGLGTLATYFTEVLPLVSHTYRAALGNISARSLGWRLFDGTGDQVSRTIVAPPLFSSPAAAQLVSTALPALLLLVAGLAVRKQRSLDVSFAVMVGVTILTSPISWPHYLVLAAIPAAHVVRWLLRHHLPPRETNWALVVAMLLITDWSRLAGILTRVSPTVARGNNVKSALALLPLMTAVAVGSLARLVAWLGPANSDTLATAHD